MNSGPLERVSQEKYVGFDSCCEMNFLPAVSLLTTRSLLLRRVTKRQSHIKGHCPQNSKDPFSTGNMTSIILQGNMVGNVSFFSLLNPLWYKQGNLVTDFGMSIIRSLLEIIYKIYSVGLTFDPQKPLGNSPSSQNSLNYNKAEDTKVFILITS